MSKPKFQPQPRDVISRPGALNSNSFPDQPRRVAALERRLAGKTMAASMYKSGTQLVAENTLTKVTGFTRQFDTTGTLMVDTTNSRIKLPRIGVWRVAAGMAWAPASINLQNISGFTFFNGGISSQASWTARPYLGTATYGICAPTSTMITTTAVTDYIELGAYWYGGPVGGNHTVDGIGGGQYVWIEAEFVGPA